MLWIYILKKNEQAYTNIRLLLLKGKISQPQTWQHVRLMSLLRLLKCMLHRKMVTAWVFQPKVNLKHDLLLLENERWCSLFSARTLHHFHTWRNLEPLKCCGVYFVPGTFQHLDSLGWNKDALAILLAGIDLDEPYTSTEIRSSCSKIISSDQK